MILVFGSINLDLVARARAIPRPGETVLAPRYERLFGGKGANQAVAAARARRDTALPVCLAAAVGADEFGRAALENLRANAVAVDAVQLVEAPTGCAFITVNADGENAITVASGANAALRAAALPEAALDGLRVLVLQMEVPAAEALEMAHRARVRGAAVVLNLAPAPEDGVLLPALLAASTVLVANEHEALAAVALLGGAEAEPVSAMRWLVDRAELAGIVTLGAGGAAVFTPDGAAWRLPALPLHPVDTTGAGDTFVGVLAAALAEGMAMRDAVARACRGASLACLVPGAQPGMPWAEALEEATTLPD